MLKFKNQDAYEARFRALQIVDERAAVKSVNGVLPDDAGAITLTPANINAAPADDYALRSELFSGSYNDLKDKPAISAVPTDEINANTAARHSHDNKTVLDGITSEKIAEWDKAHNTTDSVMSDTSVNAVQNKVIKKYVDEKATVLQSKSITDSGGHFTSDTVEGALQEIGAELAGLNTLLGSGIQISFTIEDATCTAIAGQTFSEWVGSGYKTIENGMILSVHPYSDEGVIFLDEAGVYALSLDGNTPVHGGDRIISGATYVAMNWGG